MVQADSSINNHLRDGETNNSDMYRDLTPALYAFLFILGSLIIGSIGFMMLENYSFLEGIYMSMITFSTVGFREVHPLSENGKIFVIFYIILNLGLFAYTASVISSYLFEGKLKKIYKSYTDIKALKKLSNHIIVCGFGKTGQNACRGLQNSKNELLVIENNADLIDGHKDAKAYKFLTGDAIQEDTLKNAQIEEAETIIITLPSDADNVFITLTARELNPGLKIIAKATELSTEKKLRVAGADHVIMPERVGGSYMASLVTKPSVIEFLNILDGQTETGYELEEVRHELLKKEFQGLSLGEMDVKNNTGATILAFKDSEKGFVFDPNSDIKCNEGDVIILLGKNEAIKKFQETYIK